MKIISVTITLIIRFVFFMIFCINSLKQLPVNINFNKMKSKKKCYREVLILYLYGSFKRIKRIYIIEALFILIMFGVLKVIIVVFNKQYLTI